MTTDATEPTPRVETFDLAAAIADLHANAPAAWARARAELPDKIAAERNLALAHAARLRQQRDEARRELVVARDERDDALKRRMANHKITAERAVAAEKQISRLVEGMRQRNLAGENNVIDPVSLVLSDIDGVRRHWADDRGRRDVAEERYRQLAGEVTHVANAVLSTIDTMRQEATEAREIVAHRGEDECPGWLDRANALDEYGGKIVAALGAVREHLPAVLRMALAATAPTDTPTTPLPDWERELIERQAQQEAEAVQGESGLSTRKVGNIATWGWRCQDGCGEYGLNFATEAEVDAAMAAHRAERHPVRVEAGSEAQEGAEALRRRTVKATVEFIGDEDGGPYWVTSWTDFGDGLHIELEQRPPHSWQVTPAGVIEAHEATMDLLRRRTSERDEARERLLATDSWAAATCEQLGLNPARDTLGFQVAEIARWIDEQRADLERVTQERDEAQAELSEIREESRREIEARDRHADDLDGERAIATAHAQTHFDDAIRMRSERDALQATLDATQKIIEAAKELQTDALIGLAADAAHFAKLPGKRDYYQRLFEQIEDFDKLITALDSVPTQTPGGCDGQC